MTEDEFEIYLRDKIPNPNFVLENYKEWSNVNVSKPIVAQVITPSVSPMPKLIKSEKDS